MESDGTTWNLAISTERTWKLAAPPSTAEENFSKLSCLVSKPVIVPVLIAGPSDCTAESHERRSYNVARSDCVAQSQPSHCNGGHLPQLRMHNGM